MMRYLKILFLSMVVIGLMAGTAFAGTTLVNFGGVANNAPAVAFETLGADRGVRFAGTGNAQGTIGIGFLTGQALVQGNLLVINLVNAKFPGNAINVCGVGAAGAADGIIGNLTPAANSTNAIFQLNVMAANMTAAGNLAFLTEGGCAAAATANLVINISAETTPAAATIQIVNQTSGGITVDSSTTRTLATVGSEFTVANLASFHVIDYLGTPGNGTRLLNVFGGVPNLTADSFATAVANTVQINRTVVNYATTANVAGVQNSGLTVAAVVNLTDSESWQGVSRLYLMGPGAACNFAANLASRTSPSGVVALNIPATAGGFNGSAGNVPFSLCVEVNGTTALNTRTIQANADINVTGVGANDPGASTYANAQLWGLNAYQALIPWVVNASTVPTYCLINSAETTRTANVILDVLSSEGAVTILNQSLGSIAPQTSILGTFTANSVTLGSGTPVSLTTLGTDRRYASRITVAANPNNISIACIQTDPISGAKRAVPVLTNAGAWNQ